MERYQVSVQFSGGAASYVAAKMALAEFPNEQVAIVFADTKIEDEDLYRFLDDAERRLNHPITRIAEGRDVWEVFFDEGMMGNSQADPCSRILKRELLDKWRLENCTPDCTVIVGFDSTEDHRTENLQRRLAPVTVRSPLAEAGIWREMAHRIVEQDGLKLPRLYKMNFPHNNCGGFCIKAGHGTFALLLNNFPNRYLKHEQKERDFRAKTGKDVSIMRDRTGGVTKPLTMEAFRRRVESDPASIDMFDLGGCNCMEEPSA